MEGGGKRSFQREEKDRPRKYNDFETIDWQKDLAADQSRHRLLLAEKHVSCLGKLSYIFDAWSGWVCIFFVGCICGLVIGSVDIGTTWMVDLKEGICADAFWLNKEQCCWAHEDANVDELGFSECPAFKKWSNMFGIESSGGEYLFSYFTYLLFGFMFAWLATIFPRVYAPYASGSGVSEIKTILSGYVMHNFLGKWTLLTKSVSLMLSVASGLVLGKEGPMVHIGGCVGNMIASFFPKYAKNQAKRREILSAACAAGVACAFDAPVGGVLFSLEEVSYFFPLKTLWRSFFCTMIAVLTLQLMNPYGTDNAVLFKTTYTHDWDFLEIIPFMLLGVLGGLWGAMFIKLNIKYCQYRRSSWLSRYPVSEVLGLAIVSGLFSYPLSYARLDAAQLVRILVSSCTYGDTSDLCDYRYEGNMSMTSISGASAAAADTIPNSTPLDGVYRALWQLSIVLLLKVVLMIITIGAKIPAGLYIPSMAVGALMGRIVGIIMQLILADVGGHDADAGSWAHYLYSGFCVKKGRGGCINPGLYAMMGAAAALAGATRMTVALVVIMYELTGGIKYMVPMMTVVMFSKWVADALSKDGINEAYIILNGYPYLDNKAVCHSVTVAGDLIDHRPIDSLKVLYNGMKIREIEELLRATAYKGFPVVTGRKSRSLFGFVTRKDLQHAMVKVFTGSSVTSAEFQLAHVVGHEEQRRRDTEGTGASSFSKVNVSRRPPAPAAAAAVTNSSGPVRVITADVNDRSDNKTFNDNTDTATSFNDDRVVDDDNDVSQDNKDNKSTNNNNNKTSKAKFADCPIDDEYDIVNHPTVESRVFFSENNETSSDIDEQPSTSSNDNHEPIYLSWIVDLCPTTVTTATPTRQVFDTFCKLGLRHCLVTHLSKLRGIITRKDLLQHLKQQEALR